MIGIIYRISIISSNALSSFLKQAYTYILITIFSLIIWFSPDCSLFAFGDEIRLATETCFSTILLGSLTLSLMTTCGSIQEEIENKTLLTLIAKPMSRSEFILGKYFGSLFISFVTMAVLYAIFFLMANTRIIDTPTERALKFPISLDQSYILLLLFMESSIVLAFSILIAPFFSMPINLCLSLAFMILANVSHLLEGIFKESSTVFSLILKGIFYFIPNFTLYNLGDLLAKGNKIESLNVYTQTTLLYTICFLGIYLSLAMILFNKKDI